MPPQNRQRLQEWWLRTRIAYDELTTNLIGFLAPSLQRDKNQVQLQLEDPGADGPGADGYKLFLSLRGLKRAHNGLQAQMRGPVPHITAASRGRKAAPRVVVDETVTT
jgi:hypothetical protein